MGRAGNDSPITLCGEKFARDLHSPHPFASRRDVESADAERHVVVCPPVELATRDLLPHAAPLLEEERNAGLLTLIADSVL